MVNGKAVSHKRNKTLNHLDRICFACSNIYVFYYPLLNKCTKEIVEKKASENDGVPMNLRLQQAWADITEDGIIDFKDSTCANYAHIDEDQKAIDWDLAFAEVEDSVKAKQAKEAKEAEKVKDR